MSWNSVSIRKSMRMAHGRKVIVVDANGKERQGRLDAMRSYYALHKWDTRKLIMDFDRSAPARMEWDDRHKKWVITLKPEVQK